MPALKAESFASPVAEERILFPLSAPAGPDVALVFDAAGVSKWTASAVALSANVYSKAEVDALIASIDLSGYVTLSGTQTITGPKTFSGNVTLNGALDGNPTSVSLLLGSLAGAYCNLNFSPGGISTSLQTSQFYSGFFTFAENVLDGTVEAYIDSSTLSITGATSFVDSITTNTIKGIGNVCKIQNLTNAQKLEVYNTYTSSTSYERGVIDWKTVANTLRIGTEKGSGGGTARALSIVTDGTARLTFSATAEAMTMPAAFTEFFAAGFGLGVRRSDNSTFMFGHSHSQGFLINSSSSLGFAAGADNAPVARVSYTSTGTFLDLRSAGGIRSRLLDNSADAPISASTGTFSSTVTTSKLFLSGAGSNVWIQQTASNQMDFAVNDSARLRINTAGITFLDTGEGFGFSDAKFYRDAAGVLGQRNSTTSQCLAVYNTYTSSTSYERGVFDWKTTANTLRIGTEKGSGGGTARALSLVTDGIARLNIAATGAAVFTSSVWSQPGNGYNGYVQFNGAGNQYPYFTLGATNLEFQFVLNGPGGGTVDMRCPSTLRIQDQSGNNPQSFTAKDMTLSPSASRTLSGNGQFTIEMTSNTAGNLVYRGSDGTTRRHALTFI